jgi:Domain of unknown function (DUF4389)
VSTPEQTALAVPDPSGPPSPAHAARLEIAYPSELNRWLPLIVAGALYWLTGVLTIVAFFTILFTKRIPRDVFELMVPGLRWNLRGNAYACFMTDRYPPFVWG